MRRSPLLAVGAVAASLIIATPTAAFGGAGAALHARPGELRTIASDLNAPLSFDVAPDGSIFVGETPLTDPGASGTLTRISRNGQRSTVATAAEVAAVSEFLGSVTWAERVGAPGEAPSASVFSRQDKRGKVQTVDLLAYETANNPDQRNTYGLTGLSPDCEALITANAPYLLPGPGVIDSHAYGAENIGLITYVADAGANAVLSITASGRVSTLAVLPPTPIPVTEELAAGAELPPCVVGSTYVADPVPTDVELGLDGNLYVTTLPGGPEVPGFGSLYRVSPFTGTVTLVATGFGGATGLAIGLDGTIFVAELFAGRVSQVSKRGEVSTFLELPFAAAVEWHAGQLYVSTTNIAFGTPDAGKGALYSLPIR